MKIFSLKQIEDFERKNCQAKDALRTWYYKTLAEKWQSSHEIKEIYPSASFLKNNRVVFNIKGNKYRLVVDVNYRREIVFIVFIGTHAEYDKRKF